MVFGKMRLLWWGNITQSRVSPVAQQNCWSCGCLRASPPSTEKNQIALETMVLMYLLTCWVLPVPHFHYTAVCQGHPSKENRCGSSFLCDWKWASLQWTCSLCFMSWNHENCIFGQRIYKRSYEGFFFFFKEKKGARLSAYLLVPDQRFWTLRSLCLDWTLLCLWAVELPALFSLYRATVTLYFP